MMTNSAHIAEDSEDYTLFMDSIRVSQLSGLFVKITPEHPMLPHHRKVLKDEDFKGKILDVGSNYGVFGIIAKQLDETRDVCCLDGSLYACDVALALANKSDVKIDIYYNKIGDNIFEDKSLDTITILHTMEHIGDLNRLMIWMRRLLKDDGTIFITVPYKNCNPDPNHIHMFSTGGTDDNKYVNIKQFIKEHGFDGSVEVFDGNKENECGKSLENSQWNIYIKCKKANKNE